MERRDNSGSKQMANQETANQDAASAKPVPGGKTVLVEFENGIAWVTMNRPEKRNAISPTLAARCSPVIDALEIDDALRRGRAHRRRRVLHRRHGPEGIFPRHRQLTPKSAADLPHQCATANGAGCATTPSRPSPWSTAGASAARFTPLISCDLAIAAEEATFGLSEINWGIIPAGIVTKAVAARDEPARRALLHHDRRALRRRKAAAMGLVNEAVPLAQLRERTVALAKVLLAKNPSCCAPPSTPIRACATCRGTMPRITCSPRSTSRASSIPRRAATRA